MAKWLKTNQQKVKTCSENTWRPPGESLERDFLEKASKELKKVAHPCTKVTLVKIISAYVKEIVLGHVN